ncbi:streptophobe family protein [Streptomyces sp. NPDC051555]|uniref:streptophobe family protein n=1 Tax=Streptomyces sp. NPDC051555 TaxID=3365657 RepID=UPI0037BC0716
MHRMRWGEAVLSAVAAVGWSLIVMAGVAALGLHLLGADAAGGSLGAMTAAVVVLAMGGSVTPTGDVSVFGVAGAGARTGLDVMPLGVALAGALVLGFFFLRSLRVGAGPAELGARAALVAALLVATAGALGWFGHDVVTLDGALLPRTPAKVVIPGIGDVGGLLPDRIGDLIGARARVGFAVETGPTLLGAAVWVCGVLAVALLSSRRGPAVLARLRPAVSAVLAMLLVAVVAGLGAAVWAAAGDAHPGRVLGAALLGAPNGAWVGVLLGLFVPFDGRVTGDAARLLPDPVDRLFGVPGAGSGTGSRAVTVGRLAEYDQRVWLLVVGVALLLLYAGTLAAVRTPGRGVVGCAVRLGAVTGVALGVLAWLTGLSANASLAVVGVDAVGAGVELRGDVLLAVVLGGVWGTVAGGAGAVLVVPAGAGAVAGAGVAGAGAGRGASGGASNSPSYRWEVPPGGAGIGPSGAGAGGAVPGSGAGRGAFGSASNSPSYRWEVPPGGAGIGPAGVGGAGVYGHYRDYGPYRAPASPDPAPDRPNPYRDPPGRSPDRAPDQGPGQGSGQSAGQGAGQGSGRGAGPGVGRAADETVAGVPGRGRPVRRPFTPPPPPGPPPDPSR